MKMDTTDVTWYEDSGLLEYWIGDGHPEDKQCKYCSLKEAVQFAFENKMLLYIQPELQDSGLFIDYTD